MKIEEAVKEMQKGKECKCGFIKYKWKNDCLEYLDGYGVWHVCEITTFTIDLIKEVDWEVVEDESKRNPAHYCLSCDKYLGHRGFCNKECHDKWYDEFHKDVGHGWKLSDRELYHYFKNERQVEEFKKLFGFGAGLYFKKDIMDFIKKVEEDVFNIRKGSERVFKTEVFEIINKRAGNLI